MLKKPIHPLIAGIFDSMAKTMIEKKEREAAALERAKTVPPVVVHRNDTKRLNRIAKTLASPRQLKKMRKAQRRVTST